MWSESSSQAEKPAEQKPLIEVFGSRPDRFDLLKRGVEKAGLTGDDFVIEVGCAQGDGTFFLTENKGCRVLGVDFEATYIARALDCLRRKRLSRVGFTVARAERLPVRAESVDLVVSEAAFSLLPDKKEAVEEFGRILKPGGRVLVNDFSIRNRVEGELRQKMGYIPCFAGVGRIGDYCRTFEQAGFETCAVSDESKTLIRTALWIGKAYRSKAADLSQVFAQLLACPSAKDDVEVHQKDCQAFFSLARIGYIQAVFRKPSL